jgi:predicted nucleotidyltransferase
MPIPNSVGCSILRPMPQAEEAAESHQGLSAVDVVEKEALKPRIRDSILAEAETVF